ncbi:MAG: uncharacterized protein QOF78_3139 [Phycisphaerales bacterium]|jgi:TPR repeat protein|nr:uncharacterized protein [Phycisphaerales bacterium]
MRILRATVRFCFNLCACVIVILAIAWACMNAFQRSFVLAHLGRVEDQYVVGAHYKSGIGVAQDYRKAVEWFKRAANADYPPAMFEYGVMRHYGLGCGQETFDAQHYLRKAADAGLPEAQFVYGSLLLHRGYGQSDRAQAEKFLRQAAEARYVPAEYTLACEYFSGERLRQDHATAELLLSDLSEQGYQPAQQMRDELQRFGELAESDRIQRSRE